MSIYFYIYTVAFASFFVMTIYSAWKRDWENFSVRLLCSALLFHATYTSTYWGA